MKVKVVEEIEISWKLDAFSNIHEENTCVTDNLVKWGLVSKYNYVNHFIYCKRGAIQIIVNAAFPCILNSFFIKSMSCTIFDKWVTTKFGNTFKKFFTFIG